MIYEGCEKISALMLGDMGIKTVSVGGETIYTRPGGYLFIELNTKETENG